MSENQNEKKENHVVTNILAKFMQGEPLIAAPRSARKSGPVTMLRNVYLPANSELRYEKYQLVADQAPQGISGAMIAQVLCHKGYLKYWFQGQVIEAGTPFDKQPDCNAVQMQVEPKCAYEFVTTPPSSSEFLSWIRPSSQKIASGE